MSATCRIWACGLLLAVSACTLGPDFERPSAPGAPSWRDPSVAGPRVDQHSDTDPKWWNSFHDPVLDALIEKAIAGNLDLQQAMLRVVEARQGVVMARAAGLPTLNATGSYMRQQLGVKGILESKGLTNLNNLADRLGLSPEVAGVGENSLNQITKPFDLFQYGLDASWELDLFGRVRRSVEEARAQTEAQAEVANDALVVLESDVAQAYVQLRGAQEMTATQQENVRAAADALELTQRRQQRGLTTELDVEQARTQLEDTERQLPGFEKQTQQAMNALSVLTGQTPGALDAMLAGAEKLPRTPAVIGVGVPSTLARRRPDIREAEAQLHAATAGIGVAVADFYPDISLTGSLGLRATDASFLTFSRAGPATSTRSGRVYRCRSFRAAV
jgi:multidrug efflux system outer membrane protein